MNVPKLRFKEFNDDWKKLQLKSFVDINPKNDSNYLFEYTVEFEE